LRRLLWLACFAIGCTAAPTRQTTDTDKDGGVDAGTDAGLDAGCPGTPGYPVYSESFAGTEGSDWPAPWYPIGTHLAWHDIYNNQGRFRSDGLDASPGRMQLPNTTLCGFSADAWWTVSFEDPNNQGSGLYVRQNGQYIGEGYELFIDGSSYAPTHLTFWYAVNGVEHRFFEAPVPAPAPLLANTKYRVHFQVYQVDSATTSLRGKIWPATDCEPSAWQIETTDTTPSLQYVRGNFAFDVYNYSGTANVLVSDLVITQPSCTR